MSIFALSSTSADAISGSEKKRAHDASTSDIIGFSRREFAGTEADGSVTISVLRSGPCKGTDTVSLITSEAVQKSSFVAVRNKDYDHTN